MELGMCLLQSTHGHIPGEDAVNVRRQLAGIDPGRDITVCHLTTGMDARIRSPGSYNGHIGPSCNTKGLLKLALNGTLPRLYLPSGELRSIIRYQQFEARQGNPCRSESIGGLAGQMRSFPTRIFLTGFMGSGKSTIGPMVANVLGYDAVDLDDRIVEEIGMPIRDYFQTKGETAFREVERRLLADVLDASDIVVSLGGGTIMDPTSLEKILSTGLLVYLKWTPESLAFRLRHARDRPLLLGPDGQRLDVEQLTERIRELLSEREGTYQRAQLSIPLDGYRVGWSVDQVVNAIRRAGRYQI